jgi:hypothetical protein
MSTSDAGHMTEKMSRAGAGTVMHEDKGLGAPKQGDRFHCDSCGMEVEVTTSCASHDQPAHFHCCGQEMRKV